MTGVIMIACGMNDDCAPSTRAPAAGLRARMKPPPWSDQPRTERASGRSWHLMAFSAPPHCFLGGAFSPGPRAISYTTQRPVTAQRESNTARFRSLGS